MVFHKVREFNNFCFASFHLLNFSGWLNNNVIVCFEKHQPATRIEINGEHNQNIFMPQFISFTLFLALFSTTFRLRNM